MVTLRCLMPKSLKSMSLRVAAITIAAT
ncbi:hypothetical protein VCHENC03_0982A, partial [Vibrio sp. HENC-03]